MAAKPFSDRIIPELSNIPMPHGETSFTAKVTIECAVPCRGQISALLDGKVQATVGFEESHSSVIMNGVFLTGEGQNFDMEVDCKESVLVTGNLQIQGSEPLAVRRFQQKEAVLVGTDPKECQVDRCRTPALAGRILCHLHAYPGEKVKSDRRRAIEATIAKRAKVSEGTGR
jgi:hypothetical protein